MLGEVVLKGKPGGRMVAMVVGVRVRTSRGMGEGSLMGECGMKLRVSRGGRWMD